MTDDTVFLKEGYTVWIDEPLNGFYRIVRREPFDYVTGEEKTNTIFSTVAPGGQSGFKNIAILEPDQDPFHLYQVLWGVNDREAKYYVKIPTGQNRFGIDQDKEIGFINADKSPYFDPDPIWQFYLRNDYIPSINCVNVSPVTLTPKIWFKGMKYDIAQIAEGQAGPVYRKIIFGGVSNTP